MGVTPGTGTPGTEKGNESAREGSREDLLYSPAEAIVFLMDVLAGFSTGEFVIVLVALVGILSMLLVVTASVAYLALPRGRLCPHCGGATYPVVLRRLLRVLSRWVEWRWCSRCGWEGAGRRGPDLGPLDPPDDHDSGFRWGDPDIDEVPIFYWRSDRPAGKGSAPSNPSPGFTTRAGEEPIEPTDPTPRGFRYSPPKELRPPPLPLGKGMSLRPGPGAEKPHQTPRPWYLSWLVSKNPPGFQWKERGD